MRSTLLLTCVLTGCAHAPAAPLVAADAVPLKLETWQVQRDVLVELLRRELPQLDAAQAGKVADEAFSGPPNTTVAVHNEDLRFDVLVARRGADHFAAILHTTESGYPILPMQLLATAVVPGGLAGSDVIAFSRRQAQCLATSGSCSALVVYDTGNASIVKTHVNKLSPSFVEISSVFVKKGAFDERDYGTVIRGATGLSVTAPGKPDAAGTVRVPVLQLPAQENKRPEAPKSGTS